MSVPKHPKAIVAKAQTITGRRSRIVVDHILKHGSITTEDLDNYGYKHPPRAIKDVTDQGLPLDRFWTKNADGRRIAGYRFGDPKQIRRDRLGGRKVFSKKFKAQVAGADDFRCAICNTRFEERYLQIDHRIPYEVAGDSVEHVRDPVHFMPLCGSCNRAKSWSCEHCRNWKQRRDPKVCMCCYWASPSHYSHVAMREIRRLALLWEESEVKDFDALSQAADKRREAMPEFVKRVLRRHLKRKE